MKKILVASLFTLAGLIGCTSPSDQLCLKSAECLGEDDPAAYCKKQSDDLNEDEKACRDKCAAQNDALATCCLENGECDEIEGTDTKAFCFKASSDQCKDQSEEAAKCAEDC